MAQQRHVIDIDPMEDVPTPAPHAPGPALGGSPPQVLPAVKPSTPVPIAPPPAPYATAAPRPWR